MLASSPSQIYYMLVFFVLKDSKTIFDVHGIQGMRCVMCHGNWKTQVLKALTTQGTKNVLLPTTHNMALSRQKNTWKMNMQLT